jgi:hypothetical protein
MRDNIWLKSKFFEIWERYFADVEIKNSISVSFGRHSRRRLASIKQATRSKKSDTIVTVTKYYQDERVPEIVIDATLAHEMCHYVHGFGSPHPQLFRHPHLGSAVDIELRSRGLGAANRYQKKWIKDNWPKITGEKTVIRRPRRQRILRQYPVD